MKQKRQVSAAAFRSGGLYFVSLACGHRGLHYVANGVQESRPKAGRLCFCPVCEVSRRAVVVQPLGRCSLSDLLGLDMGQAQR